MKVKSFATLMGALFIVLGVFLKVHPIHSHEAVVELSLYVGPILFGLFLSFSISERLARIDSIRDFDSTERSSIIMMYKTSKLWDQHEHKKLHNLLDEYLMATLDYNIYEYYKTEKEFSLISDHVLEVNQKGKNEHAAFQLDLLAKMLDARERTIGQISDRLSAFEWVIYFFLGTMVIAPYIFANTGTISSIAVSLGLFTAVAMLLTFLYALDSLKWKQEVRIFEPYQKAFEAIGAMRYFPDVLVTQRRINNSASGKLRIGTFPDHPALTNKEMFIVDREGNKTKYERAENHEDSSAS